MTARTVVGSVEFPAGSGQPCVGARVVAQLYTGVDGNIAYGTVNDVPAGATAALTNNSGVWSLELEPNVGITPAGTVWLITIQPPDRPPVTAQAITVPDTAGPHNFTSLLAEIPGALPSQALAAHTAATAAHGVAGSVVGTTDTQTLTNKTLVSLIISVGMTFATAAASLAARLAMLVQRKHMIDVRDDFGATCDGIADDLAALQNAINSLPGTSIKAGRVILPGPCRITNTLVIDQRAVHLLTAGTGMGDTDQGALIWDGPADVPMLRLVQSFGSVIEMRFVGNDTNQPSAAIEIADPGVALHDNESTTIRNTHIGPVPIHGTSAGRVKRGVHIRGATGNDRIFMDNVSIFRPTVCGIDNENPNSLWNQWNNVLIDGRGEYVPVGIKIGGGFTANNLNFLWVTKLFDADTYGHSPVVVLNNMMAEHSSVLLSAETEAHFTFHGGQYAVKETPAGHRMVDFSPMGLGGSLIMDGLHFLGYQDTFDGAATPLTRPHLYFESTRVGPYVRINACRGLRHTDIQTSILTGGAISFDCNFVTSEPLVGGLPLYVGTNIKRVLNAGATGLTPSLRGTGSEVELGTGVLATTCDRRGVGNSTAATSGTLYLVAIALPASATITNITFMSSTTAGAALTNQWFGLFNNARQALAFTVDDLTAAWGANTAKTLALTAPYKTTYDGLHYLGVMVAAGTMPTFIAQAGATATLAIAPNLSASTTSTGLTSPPALPFTAALNVTRSAIPYAHVT